MSYTRTRRGSVDLAYRFRVRRQRLLEQAQWKLKPLMWVAAGIWRRMMFRTTFVAITGSLGKTTCKELTAAALSSSGRVLKTYRNANSRAYLARTILGVRPWHRFAVIETATGEPGTMAAAARLVRPHIAVVLSVARTHTTAFDDLDATAQEKECLLDGLVPAGVAILNADDGRVAAMAERTPHRVARFGTSPECDLRASDIKSEWPDRLAFRAACDGRDLQVRTRLVGRHWTTAVLAALLVARECGMELDNAVQALAAVEPFSGRLEPVRVPSGAVVLRDDYNGSIDSLLPALDVLRHARAGRRILVMSDYSDLGESFRGRFRLLGSLLSGAADVVVLFGQHASYGKRRLLEAGFPAETIHDVPRLPDAAELLGHLLRDGDLALLRGMSTDHVGRLFFAQLGSIRCWKTDCRLTHSCDICSRLGVGQKTLRAAATALVPPSEPRATRPDSR